MNTKVLKPSHAKWLIFLFQILSLSLIFFINTEALGDRMIFFLGGLILLALISNLLIERGRLGDKYLLLIANMLVSIALIMIYRIDPYYGERQLIFYGLGLISFFAVYFFLRLTGGYFEKLTYFYYAITVVLLIITLIFGISLGGATNWLRIGSFQFQPAEMAKLSFVFFLAAYYTGDHPFKKHKYSPYILMGLVYFLIGLFFLQRELGTAAVFMGVFFSVQLVFEKDKKPLMINFLLAALGLYLGYKLFSHVRVRFEIWQDPWSDVQGKGYQIAQSLFALAAGGLFGKGIGLGRPTTIPLSYSDFIYPAIIEEMGIFMGIGILFLFLILFYRGLKIAMKQRQPFYRVVSLGIAMLFASQAFIVIGGVLKLIPMTGITLPFMAYGGSSMLVSFMLLGVLQYTSEYLGSGEEDHVQ
ncbi:MAG: FtsW/RodA/SpoVE family cell cycle protein [Tissierellia bacterium]|jgi:cell division protein FtsW (lipid II flippase)|nr:FtsW/RodA/SpoVE family cell cycle protein [Tissierellia bacterium]